MNFERFKYFLEAYGADLRRWPADARAPAETLIASDHAAKAALGEAARLDRALDLYAVADDPARAGRLVARIAQRAVAEPARGGRFWGLGSLDLGALWPRAAALAFVMVLGIVTGMFQTDFTGIDLAGTGEQVSSASDGNLVSVDDSPYDVAGL
ncbi:MAG TPA: hypothetical protein VMF53_02545 [Alphaproteobacteria bacterium]|nr:hypothetical protein [Alphaproteobacteria bacterium]